MKQLHSNIDECNLKKKNLINVPSHVHNKMKIEEKINANTICHFVLFLNLPFFHSQTHLQK